MITHLPVNAVRSTSVAHAACSRKPERASLKIVTCPALADPCSLFTKYEWSPGNFKLPQLCSSCMELQLQSALQHICSLLMDLHKLSDSFALFEIDLQSPGNYN